VSAPRRLVVEGGTEHPSGHVVVDGDRILAVGPGPCPEEFGPALLVDGRGCLATPGLVNCHHHLYQWITRGLAQQGTLFQWLTELYPIWARLDVDMEAAAARAALAALLVSGCSTTTDHHYLFPAGAGDLLASLEPGKLADVALWRLDGLGHADVEDPVAALVLGPPAPLELLLVGGRSVVVGGELRTGSEEEITRDARAASRRLLGLREVAG
jgi:cytosine/adenosine deaminase-related metal-dependent hydrolase